MNDGDPIELRGDDLDAIEVHEAPDGTLFSYSTVEGPGTVMLGDPETDGDRLRLLAAYWDAKDRRALAVQLGVPEDDVTAEQLAGSSDLQNDLRRMAARLDALDKILDMSAPRWRRRRMRRNFKDLIA